jgi:TonB family protein
MRTAWRFSLIALVLLAKSAGAQAVDEKTLRSEYIGQVLTLRHFYKGDHLKFHSDGTLDGNAKVGPWTVDGQFTAKEISLSGASLEIKGRRISVVFDAKTKKPEPSPDLTADQEAAISQLPEKRREEARAFLRERDLDVKIELRSENPSQDEVSSAVNAVFLAPGESMIEVVPLYWRKYFAELEGVPDKAPEPAVSAARFVKGDGNVPPHQVIYPDPEYSTAARVAQFSGTVILDIAVDSTGYPADIQIKSPLGMGLDEEAVAAVSAWKFEPARRQSVAVPVTILIEIAFHLH